MASRPDERGQVLLLTGILLAFAFILFSVNLSLIANIGQQAGRESRNPVLEDYLLIRQGLHAMIQDEMRDADGCIVAPALEDRPSFEQRVVTFLVMLREHEQNRGHAFRGTLLEADWDTASQVTFDVGLYVTDGTTTIQDDVRYTVVFEGPGC